MKEVNFILNVYYNKKIRINKKVEIIGNHFFRFSKKEISKQYKCAKAITFLTELQESLLHPTFDVHESDYYDAGFIVNLTERDYELLEKCIAEANTRHEEYLNNLIIKNDYDSFFKEWAKFNHPSHNKKGDWTHKEISEAQKVQNELKDENPEIYSLIRKLAIQFNCSINLICEVASKTLYLRPAEHGYYQFNLTNKTCLEIFNEYYDKTLVDRYEDEYEKISLVRSVLNRLALFVFKKYHPTKSGYYRDKIHSRIIIDKNEDFVVFKDSKSLNNYFIQINNYTKLYIKDINLFTLLFICNQNNNITKYSYIDDSSNRCINNTT